MKIQIVEAQNHRLEEYAEVFEGYKALQLLDDIGKIRGELVWRLAHGRSVEITEFSIFNASDRRQGLGSKLMSEGFKSMQEFFRDKNYKLKRIYLYCESRNVPARALYEKHGFKAECTLKDYYFYCDAVLYVRSIENENIKEQ